MEHQSGTITNNTNTHTNTHSWTYPWYDLCLAFFPPLTHFGINLLADFRLDLSGVSREESQEALCAAVDDVDLVERHCMDHLFPLLQLSLWTLYKLCLQGWHKYFWKFSYHTKEYEYVGKISYKNESNQGFSESVRQRNVFWFLCTWKIANLGLKCTNISLVK